MRYLNPHLFFQMALFYLNQYLPCDFKYKNNREFIPVFAFIFRHKKITVPIKIRLLASATYLLIRLESLRLTCYRQSMLLLYFTTNLCIVNMTFRTVKSLWEFQTKFRVHNIRMATFFTREMFIFRVR